MSARAAQKLVPAIAVERNATCTVCRERAICGAIEGTGVLLCGLCALTIQQLIAGQRPPSARPHKRPCSCQECVTFDEGQRGELAKVVLVPLDDESGDVDVDVRVDVRSAGAAETETAADDAETGALDNGLARFSWLETD